LYDDGKSGYFTEEYGSLSGNEYTYLNGKFYLFAKDNEEIIRKKQPSFSSKEIALESSKNKRLKRLLLKGEGSVTLFYLYSVNKKRKRNEESTYFVG
jgi:hypothetical protein